MSKKDSNVKMPATTKDTSQSMADHCVKHAQKKQGGHGGGGAGTAKTGRGY